MDNVLTTATVGKCAWYTKSHAENVNASILEICNKNEEQSRATFG